MARATLSGSVSTVPNGECTVTLPFFCSTRVWRAIRITKNAVAADKTIPRTTITPTTISTIFRALLLFGAAATAGGGAPVVATGTFVVTGTPAPHFGQNFAFA